jgi:hypothetical protein
MNSPTAASPAGAEAVATGPREPEPGERSGWTASAGESGESGAASSPRPAAEAVTNGDGRSARRHPGERSPAWAAAKKHVILFLAANPCGTDRLDLDREARSIHAELRRSGYRDRFDFVTRWAAEPLDLLRELRELRPTIVHFSGHGRRGGTSMSGTEGARDVVDEPAPGGDEPQGLVFQDAKGNPQVVPPDAIAETFGAAGTSVKLVVLNACYTAPLAEALLSHVDCVIGMSDSIRDDAARSFAVGFYGGLGDRRSVAEAYKHGRAAIALDGILAQPQLRVRTRVDAGDLILAASESSSGKRHLIRGSIVALALVLFTGVTALSALCRNIQNPGMVSKKTFKEESKKTFKEIVTNDSAHEVKSFLGANRDLLDRLFPDSLLSERAPQSANIADFPIDEKLVPDFTHIVVGSFITNVYNHIIFIKLLDTREQIFSNGTTKTSAVLRAEAELREGLLVVNKNVDAFYARVIMADSITIQRAALDQGTKFEAFLVVGRRRYLTHDQLKFMAEQNSDTNVSVITYDTLLERLP